MPETAARDARRRVLDLLERGAIDADAATDLLRALAGEVGHEAAAERERILGLLEQGTLGAEQALTLLRTIEPTADAAAGSAGPRAAKRTAARAAARAAVAGAAGSEAHLEAARAARRAAADVRRRGIARMLKITIDAHEEGADKNTRIRVNVPLGLARFASRFMSADARSQLDAQGIDLAELLDQLDDEVSEGPLVDIDATEGEGKTVRILIEVV